MPDPTDFVTNLPADFEIFGDAVDTTVDGIDNRVTDLEVITTEGDLIIGDASGDPVALPIGTIGQVLASDGDTAEWITLPGGGTLTLAQIAAGNTTSGTELEFTSLTSYDKLVLFYRNYGWLTANSSLYLQINGNSGSNYSGAYNWVEISGGTTSLSFSTDQSSTEFNLTRNSSIGNSSKFNNLMIVFTNCKETGFTHVEYQLGGNTTSGSNKTLNWGRMMFTDAAAVSSFKVYNSGAYTLDQGAYTLWGG
jgi:hypothetical protein